MRLLTAIVAIGLITFFGHYVAAGQTTKQIQFAKGRSSTVIKGMTGADGVMFSLRAKSGQKIILNLSPVSNLGIKVETDSANGHEILLREEKGGYYAIGLENSGEYTIFIGSVNHKSVAFTLTVKITKLADV